MRMMRSKIRDQVESGEITWGDALEIYGLDPATLYAIMQLDTESEYQSYLDARYTETAS